VTVAHEQPGGLFVVLEGTDGSGKSTLVDHLVPLLHRSGRTVRRINRSSIEPAVDHRSAGMCLASCSRARMQ
jgi:energy-coupling factor transporter ATP-binding protein EcfA2